MTRWLTTKDALRPSTRQGYPTHIRLYLIPRLGRIRLHQLTSRDVNDLAALGRRPVPRGPGRQQSHQSGPRLVAGRATRPAPR
ncbi:hypothetical protein [Nonomuraea sp. 10N515B]|uniref:hypothetical protein n=1 Tax=Nonomuraea sp. 10N515B TaxID=3457422 RepID=UPI003FCD1CFE